MGAVGMMDSLLLYKILKNRIGAEISASGNPAIMSDTLKNNPMNEMKVFGWSKQESTTGANLIDVNSMLNACLIKNEDETYSIKKTEDDRFSKTFPVNLKAGTAVRFDADIVEYNGAYNKPLQISFFNYQTIAAGQAIVLNSDVTKVTIYQDSTNNNGTYTKFKNVILNIGDIQIPYEPYTGGQPSPSPDYPQEIVSAGSDGKIGVEVRGKNLVDVYGYSANGIPSPKAERILFNTYGTTLSTTEKTDKLIVHQEIVDGATANSYTSGYFCIGINRKLETGKDYIITFNINVIQNPFSVSTIFVLFNGIEANRAEVIGDKVTVKVSCKEDGERQYVEVRNCGMSLEISNFMITEKDENTIYEPYYEPQTISINTPTGLPAIPVDSDGNYTDANGQQWIADYVDLKLGKLYKKVTRLNLKDVDAISVAHGFHSNGNGYLSFNVKNINKGHKPISNRYKSSMWTNESGYTYVPNSNTIVFVDDRFTDKQTAIKLVQNTYVIYALTSQIETDLTPEEIQAYKNLVTYAGTTIVENDAECYMEVSAGGGDSLRAKKLALILGE
jgi:hypothetical protein